jgi:hypothetical protein
MKNIGGFLLALVFVGACASVNDAGRAYFSQGAKVKGVEPADAFLERMNTEKELRTIMYGQSKSAKIIQCTLLRNQFYVASMKSTNKEIVDAAKIFEEAYQENDDAFLTACDQVLSTQLGKNFLQIQQQYLTRTH